MNEANKRIACGSYDNGFETCPSIVAASDKDF